MPIPAKLRPVLAPVLREARFQLAITNFNDGTIVWTDPSLVGLKKKIRATLRIHQDERCYFCRRPIIAERRNMYEDIEHYLDKSRGEYRRWGIHPFNLTLACKPCNIVKGTRDLGGPIVKAAKVHPTRAGDYKWLHPYFDNYGSNIELKKGPVYVVRAGAPRPEQALSLIEDLKLDDLRELEKRKHETLQKIMKLNRLVHKMIGTGKRPVLQQKLLDYQQECIDEGFL